jgi:hypothetical protein
MIDPHYFQWNGGISPNGDGIILGAEMQRGMLFSPTLEIKCLGSILLQIRRAER